MLFNKTDQGMAEFKEILGFIYASNSFVNLKTDIILAEEEMKRLLGKKLFTAIQDFYDSDDYNTEGFELQSDLVTHIQRAIAFYAYRSYAGHADIAHSEKGRQIFVDTTEKPAFQWQIERDDYFMLVKAHQFTDLLLEYIDDNKDEAFFTENWTSQPAYEATKALFINSAREFNLIYPIDESRRFFLAIVPFITEIENTTILSVVGRDDFDLLKTEIRENVYSDEGKLIIQAIKTPLALYAMATALKRFGIQVMPNAVVENINPGTITVNSTKTPSKDAKTALIVNLEDQAKQSLISLQNLLAKRKAAFDGVAFTPVNLLERNSPENKFFRV